MSSNEHWALLPYQDFVDALAFLSLPISPSYVHGSLCGYLCAGADSQGENYLKALVNNQKDAQSRQALLVMFEVFSVSQQQMVHFDFNFQLMLPDEESPLKERALAFSEWCDGFTQALHLSGIKAHQFEEEDTQEALHHVLEFADLDCDNLDINEEDEKALMEVVEYTRMAVLRLYNDIRTRAPKDKKGGGLPH